MNRDYTGESGTWEEPQRESDRIRGDIDRTLERMDDTVCELHDRTRPKALLNQAGSALLSPGGMIGIGVAWLVIDRLTGRGRHEAYEVGRRGRDEEWGPSRAARRAEDAVSRGAAFARDKVSSGVDQVKDKASDLTHRAGEAIHSATDRVSDVASDLGHRVGDAAHYARDRAVAAGQSIQRGAQQATEQASEFYDDNPLAVGAAALAAGIACGLMLPSTRKEEELLGDAAGQLLDRAKDLGRDVLQTGKEVARTAVAAATEDVKQGGDRPIPDRVGSAVAKAVNTATQEVRSRVESPGNPD